TSECDSSNFCSPSASRLLRNMARLLKVSSRDMPTGSSAGGVPKRANAENRQDRRPDEGKAAPQVEHERVGAEEPERERRAHEQERDGQPRQVETPRQQRQEGKEQQYEVVLLIVWRQEHHGYDERGPFEILDAFALARLQKNPRHTGEPCHDGDAA